MRPRTLLILLLLVAGLSAFVWFYERDLPGTDERAKQAKKLFDLKKDDVTAVTIQRAGQEVRLERVSPAKPAKPATPEAPDTPEAPEAAATWRMTRPRAAVADALAVNGLVDSLVGIEKERTLEQPDRKALGIDSPQATVRIRTSHGETVIRFGAKVPTGGEVMAAIEGDPDAYAVGDSILTTLERDPGEWRDKQIFHGDRDAIDRIALHGAGGDVLLARRGDAFWIESPPAERDRADRDLVDSLLADLTVLRADRFVDDAKKTPAQTIEGMGLAPPKGTIEAVLRGQAQPFRVDLGSAAAPSAPPPAPATPGAPPPGPAIYARAGGQLFEAPQTGLSTAVGRTPSEWRSKALAGLQVYQVDSATVTDASGPLVLTRSGTDWKRGAVTISYTPVSDLLFAVTGAKATRLLSPDEAKKLGAALDKPILTVAMKAAKGQGGAGDETVTLYPPTAEGIPARASGRDAVLLLAKDQLDNIQKQIAAVRTAAPVKPAKAQASP